MATRTKIYTLFLAVSFFILLFDYNTALAEEVKACRNCFGSGGGFECISVASGYVTCGTSGGVCSTGQLCRPD